MLKMSGIQFILMTKTKTNKTISNQITNFQSQDIKLLHYIICHVMIYIFILKISKGQWVQYFPTRTLDRGSRRCLHSRITFEQYLDKGKLFFTRSVCIWLIKYLSEKCVLKVKNRTYHVYFQSQQIC